MLSLTVAKGREKKQDVEHEEDVEEEITEPGDRLLEGGGDDENELGPPGSLSKTAW
eukprot:CAMPEP_0201482924 /NCGR_PEP_ID=MMETSP0151_2-20130828/7183_1 /ASSEMBLY_ACC=CAM_ASM_000257 /TAXON_ID=200890 /ORGANISM="Paramoeba atlantica, Strain 621/1 / CCAP 1560/9" /LENGTH=55 /DNA_ID=CAMNT_0047865843 /DNA_START=270 /DNA_END=434 /DNA_ORIENTATION=-